jgi:hypothetical protein
MKVIVTEVAIYGEIIHYVENENIDLMVIGTRARLGFKKLFTDNLVIDFICRRILVKYVLMINSFI